MVWAKATVKQDEKNVGLGIWGASYQGYDGMYITLCNHYTNKQQ